MRDMKRAAIGRQPVLRNLLCGIGFLQIGSRRVSVKTLASLSRKLNARSISRSFSDRGPIRQQYRLPALHHGRINAVETFVVGRTVVENEPRPQTNVHVVN